MCDHMTDEQLESLERTFREMPECVEGTRAWNATLALIAQAREANRLRADYQRACVENKVLLDQLRDAKDKLEVAAAKAEAATIAKVVKWLREQANVNGEQASQAEREGRIDSARRWMARENEARVLADMIESGEWAKEPTPANPQQNQS